MGKTLDEFKAFISKGNVMDLAVGVIIGTAFTAIVNSLVKDILMPIIGIVAGKIDFGGLTANIGDAKLTYGLFINAVINFLIIAWVIFLLVKAVNKIQKPAEAAPTTKPCPYCTEAIPVAATRCPRCTSQL
jgi:large conductance mechanosensitive channel